MASIEFVMDDLVEEVEPGRKLVDVCKEVGSSIPFGCTNGICGTCVTKIIDGKEHLSKPTDQELQTLEMFGADDGDHRLLCQCIVHGNVKLDNP